MKGPLDGLHLDADQRRLVETAVRAGWVVMGTRSSHVRLIPQDKSQRIIVMATTPSDHRWRANTIAKMRRAGLVV